MLNLDDVYRQNLQKIKELLPEKQWGARQWLEDSFAQGHHFRITEAYRSPARQFQLWLQGRVTVGKIVTYIKYYGEHQARTAVDAVTLNATYEEIADTARVYGIIRPQNTLEWGDMGHFSFASAVHEPQPPVIDPVERRKRLILRMEREPDGDQRRIIGAVVKRMEARMVRDGYTI